MHVDSPRDFWVPGSGQVPGLGVVLSDPEVPGSQTTSTVGKATAEGCIVGRAVWSPIG